MTSLSQAGHMMRMLDGVLDMHFYGHYGKVRSAGNKLRINKGAFKGFLSREQGALLYDAGVVSLYNCKSIITVPIIEMLNRISPDLEDQLEFTEAWGASSLGPYVFARIVVTCIVHPELTDHIVSALMLFEIPSEVNK